MISIKRGLFSVRFVPVCFWWLKPAFLTEKRQQPTGNWQIISKGVTPMYSSRSLQTPYTIFSFNNAHLDGNIHKAQQWMEKNITTVMTVSDLAKKANLGERTFARRFKKATGDTPLEYLQHLRIGKARTFLETTEDSIDRITYAAGYEDVSSFRRLFKKITGLSPSSYRKRFCLYQ